MTECLFCHMNCWGVLQQVLSDCGSWNQWYKPERNEINFCNKKYLMLAAGKSKKRIKCCIYSLRRPTASQSHNYGPVWRLNSDRNSEASFSLAGLQSDLSRSGCIPGRTRQTETPQGEVPGAQNCRFASWWVQNRPKKIQYLLITWVRFVSAAVCCFWSWSLAGRRCRGMHLLSGKLAGASAQNDQDVPWRGAGQVGQNVCSL